MPTYHFVKRPKRRNGPIYRAKRSGRFSRTAVHYAGSVRTNPRRKTAKRGKGSKSVTISRKRLATLLARDADFLSRQKSDPIFANPRRRRRSKRRSSKRNPFGLRRKRRNPPRRRNSSRRRRNARGRRRNFYMNPKRRRNARRRRNPSGKRRRNFHRRRRNPFSTSGAKGILHSLFAPSTWTGVAGNVGGVIVAAGAPKFAAYILGMPSLQIGYTGVGVSFAGSIGTAAVASMFSPSIGAKLLGGGLVGSTLLLIAALTAGSSVQTYLPLTEALLAVQTTAPPAPTPAQNAAAAQSAMSAMTAAANAAPATGVHGYLMPGQLVRKHPPRVGVGSYYSPSAGTQIQQNKSYYGKSQGF